MADTAIDTGGPNFGMGFDFRRGQEEPVAPAPLQEQQPTGMAPFAPYGTAPAAMPQATALNTAPPQGQPPADPDEADMSRWAEDWNKAPSIVRSHYGDYRELFKGVPSQAQLEAEDPRQANLAAARPLLAQMDAKTQKAAIAMMERQQKQIAADAARKHAELRNEIVSQYKAHSERAEQGESGMAFEQRAMAIDGKAKELDGQLLKDADTADPVMKQRLAVTQLVTSQKLLGPRYGGVAAALSLKSGLLPEDAARTMNVLTGPVWPGEKGFNGYTGRAAANYRLAGVDVNGNYIVQLPGDRVVRIPQQEMRAVEVARQRGYDILRKHKAETEKRAAEPGVIEQGVKWVKRQLE